MSFDIREFDEIDFDAEDVSDKFYTYQCTLVELFQSSSRAFKKHCKKYDKAYQRTSMSPDFWIMQMMHYGFDYIGCTPAQMTADDICELCCEIFPKKITLDSPDDATHAVAEMTMFWEYLRDEFQLEHADDILKSLQDIEPYFVNDMFDPDNYDMAKSVFSAGVKLGYDMESDAGINEFMQACNAENQGAPASGPIVAPPFHLQETYVRSEKKIGRNQPCPCGSGKKYKKCCG